MTGGSISYIIYAASGLCDCTFWIAVIAAGVWFFVLRKRGGDEVVEAAAAANQAMDSASKAFRTDEDEDEVATVVAPQPPALGREMAKEAPKPAAPAAEKPQRPPRTAGATIIAFDDDDLLDE